MTRFAEMAVVVVVFLPGSWAVCDSSLSHKKTFILNTRGPVSTLPQVNLLWNILTSRSQEHFHVCSLSTQCMGVNLCEWLAAGELGFLTESMIDCIGLWIVPWRWLFPASELTVWDAGILRLPRALLSPLLAICQSKCFFVKCILHKPLNSWHLFVSPGLLSPLHWIHFSSSIPILYS